MSAAPQKPIEQYFNDSSVSDVEILEELARRAEALGRSRITPEDFHVAKSELAGGLRRLAGRLRAASRRRPSTRWRSPFDV
jgi:hypothetical protein